MNWHCLGDDGPHSTDNGFMEIERNDGGLVGARFTRWRNQAGENG